MAKQFAVASISIKSFNILPNSHSEFPVVNTKTKDIATLIKKSLLIRRTICLLHLVSVALFVKFLNKKFERLKPRHNPAGCKQACEDFHFDSTWRKTRVTANSSHSPACVSTKSTFEPKKFPLRLDKREFTLLSKSKEERKKNLLHWPQHVTVADRKKINTLEKRNKWNHRKFFLFFLKEIHSNGVHWNHSLR